MPNLKKSGELFRKFEVTTAQNNLSDANLPAQIPAPEGAGTPNYSIRPKTSDTGAVEGDLLEISMGPQHPSTHGVFRMDIVLDGEQVVKLKPVFGYLHRNHEKIGEGARPIPRLDAVAYTQDRLDYFCSMTNNWPPTRSQSSLNCQRLASRGSRARGVSSVDPR